MPSITKRHDSVLQRPPNAVHRGSFTVDKIVPGAPGINRPDLVITENNKVTIIDVTCPFENDDSALSSAALRKEEKYNYLIDHFLTLNKQAKVFVFGFVVFLAFGSSVYIRYRSDANVNDANDPSFEFIGEVILKINIV
jgi:hypothetical protein